MRLLIVALVAGIAAGAVAIRAGQDTPTFRAGVQAIEVEAVVKDAQGRFVPGLTKGDFELLEDGVVQTIDSLSLVGLHAASSSPSGSAFAQPSVASAASLKGISEHFDYVVIFDSGRTERQQKVVTSFIKNAVRPGDRLAVVETPRGVSNTLPFVTTQAEMLDAVRHVSGLFCPSAKPESFWMIRDVATRLARVSGSRKAILFVSTGTPLLWDGVTQQLGLLSFGEGQALIPATMDKSKEVRRAFEEAMRITTINRIPVHAIDPDGLQPAARRIARQSPPPLDPRAMPPLEPQENASLDERAAYLAAKWNYEAQREKELADFEKTVVDDKQSALSLVAEETGGLSIVNTNNFDKYFTRLLETQPASYVLTYTSPANQFDGALHKIVVRVKKGNLSVKSRKGYYAFSPGGSITPAVPIPSSVSARARREIEASFPASDLSATARAASLSVGMPSSSVLAGVQVDDALASFDRTKPVEIVWTAVSDDGFGALVLVNREVVRLPEHSPEAAGSNTIAAFRRLTLPEGSYRLTAMVSQENGAMALARASAVVVSRPTQPYGFTDIVLSSAAPERRTVLSHKDDLEGIVPHVPSIRAEFSRSEALEMHTEFHDVSEELTDLILRATATGPGGKAVWRLDEKLVFKNPAQRLGQGGEWIRPEGRIIRYGATIALQTLAPGGYTLNVEAIKNGKTVAKTEDVPFFVNRP
jgi:VWFA-related protein